jgi:RES domain-containing protein
MRIFRLHRKQRAASEYLGSLIYASRWNHAGTPMLYASSSLSLSCLEVLVHLKPDEIPLDYVYSIADLDINPEIVDYGGDLHDESATRKVWPLVVQ